MKPLFYCTVLAFGLTAAVAAQPACAATALNAQVSATASGEFVGGGERFQELFDNSKAKWTAPLDPNPLAASVNPTDNNIGMESLTSSSTANFISATKGTFTAVHAATLSVGEGEDRGISAFQESGFPVDFAYTFKATGNGDFELGYDIGLQGTAEDQLGAWRVGLVETDDLTTVDFRKTNPLTDPFGDLTELKGSTSFQLQAGTTYTFALLAAEGSVDPGNDTNLNFTETANFNWNIHEAPGAVPEPATWALMIGGFGLAGARLRQRKVRPQAT